MATKGGGEEANVRNETFSESALTSPTLHARGYRVHK
ncbi:hypothetical protein I7I48_10440 [Histoplasma ohiense]|nr:hypothetical protein I7I48_10440 [Histoplasma ohiense (nom. inval.)]